MSRLFAFGCSFTNYKWWSWADILGTQFEEFHNFGQAGGGNGYIFNSIMEADQRYHFGSGDSVYICWSNIMREDRYKVGRGWITLGNVMTATNVYTKEFLTDGICEYGNLLRDLNYIKAVHNLLMTKPTVTWEFLSICPLVQPDPYVSTRVRYEDLTNMYNDILKKFRPSFLEILGDQYWMRDVQLRHGYQEGKPYSGDYHPTTQEHLYYLDQVLPGLITNDQTRALVADNHLIFKKGRNGHCTEKRF